MKKIISEHWTSEPEKLEAFILDRIDKKEKIKLTAHLEKCSRCRLRVQEERDLIVGIKMTGRLKMKRRLKLRLQRDQGRHYEWTQAASIAAAVVIMLGAVFTLRWFVDFGQDKTRAREISFKTSDLSQRSLWITGKIIVQKRTFRGSLSDNNSSFIIKQGNITQIVSIKRASFAELPPTERNVDDSMIRTLLERTQKGLQLTLYTDSASVSFATGIEAVSTDSLIVYLQGQQVAYHIPGGWAGRM